MIEAIAILAMIWIAVSAVYMLKNRSSKTSENRYIWMGPGESPFKK